MYLLIPFILLGFVVFFYILRHQNRWIEARTRQLIAQQRSTYIKNNYDAIQSTLCKEDFISYLDEALDQAHEYMRQEYERANRRYMWYMEKSTQIALLKGHQISFSVPLIQEIIRHFCLKRYLLLKECIECKELPQFHIISLLCRLLIPKMDLTTRANQRQAIDNI